MSFPLGKKLFAIFLLCGIFLPFSLVLATSPGQCFCYGKDTNCSPAGTLAAGKDSESGCKETCITKLTADKFASSTYGVDTDGDAKKDACTLAAKKFEDAKAGKPATPTAPPKPFLTPTLNINLPGLVFSKPILENGNLKTNFLADYLTWMYQFLIGASITVAIVMVMIGGLQYTLGAASPDQAKKGKERVINATTGLILLLSVYLVLYSANPQLTILKSIQLKNIQFSPMLEAKIGASTKRCAELRGTLGVCSVSVVKAGLNSTMLGIINSIPQTDPFLLAAHVWMESGGALGYGARRGPCGEVGPAQFMPTTVEGMKIVPGCCTGMWAPPNKKTGVMDGWTSYVKECNGNRDISPDGPPFPKFYRGDMTLGKQFPPTYPGACGHFETATDACVQFFNSKNPNGTVNLTKVKQLLEFSKNLIEKNLSRTGGDRAQELCVYNGGIPYGKTASKKYKEFCEKSGGTVVMTAPAETTATTPSTPTSPATTPTPDVTPAAIPDTTSTDSADSPAVVPDTMPADAFGDPPEDPSEELP